MIFDGFIVLDTREPKEVVNALPVANATSPAVNKMKAEYGFGPDPTASGGGAPSAPTGGSTPMPSMSTGGGGSEGGGAGQYINPQTIAASAGLLAALAGAFQKTPDQKNLKSACGRKPLFNIGGKKDAYRACVDNYIFRQNQPVLTPSTGMEAGTKALIAVLSILALVILIIIAVVATRKGNNAQAQPA